MRSAALIQVCLDEHLVLTSQKNISRECNVRNCHLNAAQMLIDRCCLWLVSEKKTRSNLLRPEIEAHTKSARDTSTCRYTGTKTHYAKEYDFQHNRQNSNICILTENMKLAKATSSLIDRYSSWFRTCTLNQVLSAHYMAKLSLLSRMSLNSKAFGHLISTKSIKELF